jgi:hypothetical protein
MMPRVKPATSPLPHPTVRAVRAGEEISVQVDGGFVRRPAPDDGVVIELVDRDVFVSADVLLEALRALGRA